MCNLEYNHVVTSFVQSERKILLLRRSRKVGTYQGRWAAVSGYLEEGDDPLERAKTEIREELGLTSEQFAYVRSGELLRTLDEKSDTVWVVYPFLFEVRKQAIKLDWEHRWIDPEALGSYDVVPKLKETYDRVRWDLQFISPALSDALRQVDSVAQDRVHGATSLGRRSFEILAEVVKVSNASSSDELFRDFLLVISKLRKAQPSMSTIKNLTGKFLYQFDQASKSTDSVAELKNLAGSLARKAIGSVESKGKEVSRNCASIVPERGTVLTHSYSNTIYESLKNAAEMGKDLQVYVTESRPGREGRLMSKELANVGLPVTLIADSAAAAVFQDIDLVLVGADSVLADGSVINKIGTKAIATVAHSDGIPLYVGCETAKFSTGDLLGEPVEICEMNQREILGDITERLIRAKNVYFDVTPAKYISEFITEKGPVEPAEVAGHIRIMLSEIYP